MGTVQSVPVHLHHRQIAKVKPEKWEQLSRQGRGESHDRSLSGGVPLSRASCFTIFFYTQKNRRTGFPIRRQPIYLPNKSLCVPVRDQRQHQNIILYAVDKKPVRENMTFPMTCPISGQVMVTVFIRQRFAHRQQCYDLLQQFDLQATLDGSFVVFFETGRVLDGIFCFSHLFRSANNSSRSL